MTRFRTVLFPTPDGPEMANSFPLHGCVIVSSAFFSSMRAAMVSGVTDDRMTWSVYGVEAERTSFRRPKDASSSIPRSRASCTTPLDRRGIRADDRENARGGDNVAEAD